MKKSLALFLMAAMASATLFLGGCKKEETSTETTPATSSEQPKVVEETGSTATATTTTTTSTETPSTATTASTSTATTGSATSSSAPDKK